MQNDGNDINSNTEFLNTPYNYYSIFLKESNISENIFNKYFLRISEDYTTKEKSFLKFLNIFKNQKNENLQEMKILENLDLDDNNKFLIDKQIKYEKLNRLNESDSLYKIKKHHQNNLNEQYKKITSGERKQTEEQIKVELEYLKICKTAETKLKLNKLNSITFRELSYLIRRNYILFTSDQKSDIEKINNFYYSLIIANLLGVTILTSFCKSILKYFGFLKNRFILRMFVLSGYFSITVTNNTLYINQYIRKKLIFYPDKIKNKILYKENEKNKVPYDINMYEFNPEEYNKESFKYI